MDDRMRLLDKIETVDVAASHLVFLWMKEKARRDPTAFCRLTGDNRSRFKNVYGPGEDGSGKNEKIWALEELGIPIFIISSPSGTVYRINYPGGEVAYSSDRKIGSAISAFLEKTIKELSGFGAS